MCNNPVAAGEAAESAEVDGVIASAFESAEAPVAEIFLFLFDYSPLLAEAQEVGELTATTFERILRGEQK